MGATGASADSPNYCATLSGSTRATGHQGRNAYNGEEMIVRRKARLLSPLAVGILLFGCSAFDRVSRADAIEACEGAYRLLDEVPNPAGGQQEWPFSLARPTVPASDQEIDARYVAVRVATVRSGDRDLEAALESLQTAMIMYMLGPRLLLGASSEEIREWFDEFGRNRSVFLGVCRKKGYL